MSDEMQDYAIVCARKALMKYGMRWMATAYINEKFAKKYNPDWNCIMASKFCGHVTFKSQTYILLRTDEVCVLLFKT